MKLYQSAWTDRRKSTNTRQNRTQIVNKAAEKTMPKLYRKMGVVSGKKIKLLSTNKINYYLTEELLLNKLSTMSETEVFKYSKKILKNSWNSDRCINFHTYQIYCQRIT